MVNKKKIWSVCKMRKKRIEVKISTFEDEQITGILTDYQTDYQKVKLCYFSAKYSLLDGRINFQGLQMSDEEFRAIKGEMYIEIAKKRRKPILA